MLKAKRYIGTVASGSGLYESSKGTLGFQVLINCEDGATDYTIWLTDKNAERAKKDFETLGISPSELAKPKAFTLIGKLIEGTEISFEVEEQTYNNKTSMKVRWIAPKKDPGVGSLEERAASIFGGVPVQQPLTSTAEDDDVPFRTGR